MTEKKWPFNLREKLEKARQENETLWRRSEHVCGQLREAGFPEIAGALNTKVHLLSGPATGHPILDEIEGLVEVLQHGDGDPS